MNSNNLTNAAMRKKPGSLAYELAESLRADLDDLETDHEKENDASNELLDEKCSKLDNLIDDLYEIVELIDNGQSKDAAAELVKLINGV
jgi:hypothetical protein